ncbi:MAG: AAA family ATPase [Candidatus Moeniiplasma glomeromycotorum]|nr:AAA family ATPase [Candidatus Moeniiplasma glomeromycotorum]
MTIIELLESKKTELVERHAGHSGWGSRSKEILEHKIKNIDKLITAYQSTPPPLVLSEIEAAFNQQVGFEELKSKILDNLKIILLVGPTGCGKTTSACWLAQVLKRKLYTINLAGLSDPSVLVGTSESSSGSEIGLLAKSLVETESSAPLVLLDEFDKVKPSIQDNLLTVLDPVQNQAVLDYYLDVKLDFSQVIFIVTANDISKIPDYLLSRLPRVELTGYSFDQKKAIVQQFIQEFLADKESLKNNFEINSVALETLINKTKEKGVRQLRQACDKVFNYCLLRWNELENLGEVKKITITPLLVDQIIPENYFANIDQEDNQISDKEQIKKLQKELNILQKEKKNTSQIKLKTAQFRSLNLIHQKLKNTGLKKENLGELSNYQSKINQTNTPEEVEVIREEVLLYIEYQNILQKPPASPQGKSKKSDNWAEIEKWIKIFEERWRNSQKPSQTEIDKLKKALQDLQKKPPKSTWNIKDNGWFILFIVGLVSGVIYAIFKLIKSRSKSNRERERERERERAKRNPEPYQLARV